MISRRVFLRDGAFALVTLGFAPSFLARTAFAAGSTGRGEANLYNLSSFFIVEQMRAGKHPKDAMLDALRRVKANTIEKRLLKQDGNPNFDLQFYAINAKGEYAAASLYEGTYALCTEQGPQTLKAEALLPGTSSTH